MNRLKIGLLSLVIVFGFGGSIAAASSLTGSCTPPPGSSPPPTTTTSTDNGYCYNCGGGGNVCADQAASSSCTTNASSNCDLIAAYINPIINILSGLVGIVVVIGIITGAIQFSLSAGNPQKAAKAKQRMINSGVAIVAFAFLYAFLQWIVPGGIFN